MYFQQLSLLVIVVFIIQSTIAGRKPLWSQVKSLEERLNKCQGVNPISDKADAELTKDTGSDLILALTEDFLAKSGRTIRFQSANYPGRFMRHKSFDFWLDKVDNSDQYMKDSTFKVIPGLSGKGISFQSVNYPNRYLRHRGFKLYLEKNDNSDLFREDASYIVNEPFCKTCKGNNLVSLESVNYPGMFIRHAGFRLMISKMDNSDLFKKDATWEIVLNDNKPQFINPDVEADVEVYSNNKPQFINPDVEADVEVYSESINTALTTGTVIRFTSANYPDRFIRHRGFEVWLDIRANADLFRKDSTFKVIPGLSGKGISFQSVNYPNRYLRHRGFKLYLEKNDNSDLFREDASYIVNEPFCKTCKGNNLVSLESVNYPGMYIRHAGFQLMISKKDNSDLFKKDATWEIV